MDVTGTSIYQTANPPASGAAGKALGKDEFLKLFIAQMRAQDPMNPMDSTGFTSQLAQFSSLEQLTNISTGITNLTTFQGSLQNTMTTSLIGKKVKVTGDTFTLNGQADLRYALAGNAAKTTVSIYDSSGTLIRQQEVAGQTAGEQVFSWDGMDQNNRPVPAGQYKFTVSAVDSSEAAVGALPLVSGTVTGVVYENNMTYLSLDNGMKIQLGDIREIGGA